MIKFIAKRILLMIPVMIGITLLVFAIMSFTPGDPATLMLGAFASEEDIVKTNTELGYYDPFFVRYFRFLRNAVQGDLGISWSTRQPVTGEILTRFPVTMKLTLTSMVITILMSIPLGTLAALKQYSIVDNISMFLALILSAMPWFWLGLMLMLFFSLKLDWLPATGNETWLNYVLPTITMSGATTAVISRLTRTSMVEVLREDYIRTARAKGAPERRIIVKHVLRNTLIPVVTVMGTNLGAMLSGAVVVEQIFGMSGIGTLMVNAIRMKDIPTVMGCVIFLALMFSIINLLVDISYGFIDRRIQTE